jgi:hypothetical protein
MNKPRAGGGAYPPCYKRARMRQEAPVLPRWAVRFVGALCAVAAAYAVYRGLVVDLEYFDGHSYLSGTRRLLSGDQSIGFNLIRPPLVSLLQAPAVWLAQQGAPANVWYGLGPHLTAAALSLLSALAFYFALTAALPAPLALLGVAFLVSGRLFVRYAPFTMADLASMGWAALAIGCYLRAQARPGVRWEVAGGVAIGLGAATKYPLVAMGLVLVLAELLLALARRRLGLRRVAGLALTGLVSFATLVLVLAAAQGLAFGWGSLGQLPASLRQVATTLSSMGAVGNETRWDHLWLIADTTAWPLLALALLGLGVAAKDRDQRDIVFAAWLLGLGGIFVYTMRHNEARYLLPVVPPLLYFAVRGVGWLLARAPRPAVAGPAVVALAIGCSWGGLRQAWADRDPVFTADAYRQSALALARLRQPGGHLRWVGGFSCLYPVHRLPLPRDEFFDSFHFHGPTIQYFLGEPATVIPGLEAAADKDAVMAGVPNCNTAALPAGPPPPYNLYGVSRRPLSADTTTSYLTATKDLSLSLDTAKQPWVLRVTRGLPAPAAGQLRTLILRDPHPRMLPQLPLATGNEIPLRGAPTTIELLELTLVKIPTR